MTNNQTNYIYVLFFYLSQIGYDQDKHIIITTQILHESATIHSRPLDATIQRQTFA